MNRLTIQAVAAETDHTRAAVERWIHTGVWVAGRRVRLAALRVGGRYQIDREALAAFVAACNPTATPAPTNPAKDAKRRADASARVLAHLKGGSK